MDKRNISHTESYTREGLEARTTRRDFLKRTLAAGVSLSAVSTILAACGSNGGGNSTSNNTGGNSNSGSSNNSGKGTANILFTFWGSPNEKKAVGETADKFNKANSNIKVRTQHIPGDYQTKITTMLAGGNPPDMGYLGGDYTMQWGSLGKLVILNDYFRKDPLLKDTTKPSLFKIKDKIIASQTANEFNLIYYNKDLFDQAKMGYPPSSVKDAWGWDKFLDVAKKLTTDKSGNDATSSKFDPKNIQTYGISPLGGASSQDNLVYSNGGRYVSEDGMKLVINEPKTTEALQLIADLMYKHHVAPSPTASKAFPSANIMMQSRKVAMTFGGQWEVLDYSNTKGLNWGMAVMPVLKKPRITVFGGATVIFKKTENPDACVEFMKYLSDPQKCALFTAGLWMPPYQRYYTDPQWTKKWIEGQKGVYPPEAKNLFTKEYILDDSVQTIDHWVKNFTVISDKALNPSYDKLWNGKATAQEAMDEAVKKSQGLMKGVWTTPPKLLT